MKDVIITIRCSLEPLKKHARFYTDELIRSSVTEAIEDAVRRGEQNGFNHGHDEDFSIIVRGVSSKVEKA